MLTRLLPPKSDPELIRGSLSHVWVSVSDILDQDPDLRCNLATKEQFRKNVAERGEDVFVDQLQSYSSQVEVSNSETTWMPLLKDGMFLFWFDLKCSHFLYLDIFFTPATSRPPVSEPDMRISQAGLDGM